MSGARPGRGGRDVAGSAMAGGVGQGTAVQDQGNPFGITACSTGSGGTSDSSEPSGDADLSPGHHGHGRALRPRIGHLGHRLTCGAAPGRGTRGRSPFPDDAALEITSGPFEWVPGRAGRAFRPLPVRGSRSASSHAARADEGSDGATSRKPLLGGRRPLLRALLEGVPGTGGGGGPLGAAFAAWMHVPYPARSNQVPPLDPHGAAEGEHRADEGRRPRATGPSPQALVTLAIGHRRLQPDPLGLPVGHRSAAPPAYDLYSIRT